MADRHAPPVGEDFPGTEKAMVHHKTCRLVPTGTGEAMSAREILKAHPYAYACSTCMPGGFAQGSTLLVMEPVEPHEYKSGMVWPGGEPRPLCVICKTPHKEAGWRVSLANVGEGTQPKPDFRTRGPAE